MTEKIDLNGQWKLTFFKDGSHTILHPDGLSTEQIPSIPAIVPGNVELDLVRAGIIPEPFYANNIRQLRPYEFYEYWYEKEFYFPEDAPTCPWVIVFAGLDTIASIWVNGSLAGKCANMLIEHRFDVSNVLLRGKTNHIAVQIKPSVVHAMQYSYDAGNLSWEFREEGGFIRKAPHMWGWDIMPRVVTAGIWRSVWLEPIPENAIDQAYFWTDSIDEKGAVLGFRYQFHTTASIEKGLHLLIHGKCGDHEFHHKHPVEFIAGGCRIPVPGARLWFPRGYGEPNLYQVTLQLLQGEKVLAERKEKIGIRKLELKRTLAPTKPYHYPDIVDRVHRVDIPPDEESHFILMINDQPILIKGVNWVPLDAFHSRDAERLSTAMEMVVDLGCNILRCWGGNVYEDHPFFDLCDQNGILVWQDFAFACNIYPQCESFLEEVRKEAEAVVTKLRNHPSLALWCGDNEVDLTYGFSQRDPSKNRINREVLPRVVERCDPHRPYIPSSPHVSPETFAQPDWFYRTAEQHLWGPRGYFKSPFYTRHNAHFIGEIGYHGCPNRSSIEKFISPDKLFPWQNNDEWLQHSVDHWIEKPMDRDRIKLMANQIREMFGEIPDNLDDFSLASQITQAEAVKFFIESARLRKWYTSGILWWNLLDGYPQFSDAVVDYYFNKKLAYFYIKRSQLPVCVIIGEPGAGKYLPVVACNDTLFPAHLSCRVVDCSKGTEVLHKDLAIPANQNWQLGCIRTYASDQTLYQIIWEMDGIQFTNHYISGTPPYSLKTFKEWLKIIQISE